MADVRNGDMQVRPKLRLRANPGDLLKNAGLGLPSDKTFCTADRDKVVQDGITFKTGILSWYFDFRAAFFLLLFGVFVYRCR